MGAEQYDQRMKHLPFLLIATVKMMDVETVVRAVESFVAIFAAKLSKIVMISKMFKKKD